LFGFKANASRRKAISCERMGKPAEELEVEVAGWIDCAAAHVSEKLRLRARQERRGDAGMGRRQEAAPGEDP